MKSDQFKGSFKHNLQFHMQSQLSFGADCVIKLEDFGEFKDYSDTLDTLKYALETSSHEENFSVPNEFWEIIESDPEDTFFLPDFQKVLKLIASKQWSPYVTQSQNLKILGFYFRVIEQALISFSFEEETVDTLLAQILESKKTGEKLQKLVLKLVFGISDKVIYIEQFNKIATLWNCLDEETLFNSYPQENVDVVGAVYAQCCQKYLRSRQLRKLIQDNQNTALLMLKLSLWEKDKAKFNKSLNILRSKSFYNSTFIKELCSLLQISLFQQ